MHSALSLPLAPRPATEASFPTAPTTVSSQPRGLRPMDSPDAIPLFLGKRVLLSFNPLSGYRSGLQCSTLRLMPSRGCVFRHCSASVASPVAHLIRPLLTSPRYSAPITQRPASILRSTGEISRGKTRIFRCASAGFTKCILSRRWRASRLPCPLAPDAPRLISGFCSSPRSFGFSFLREPASRRRPCRFPSLRLCENLAVGLPPT